MEQKIYIKWWSPNTAPDCIGGYLSSQKFLKGDPLLLYPMLQQLGTAVFPLLKTKILAGPVGQIPSPGLLKIQDTSLLRPTVLESHILDKGKLFQTLS